MIVKFQKKTALSPLPATRYKLQASSGFTLMEIVVATTIFAVTCSSILALFDYTLKINRRAEALRQASQGIRNLMEYVVKEVRNGQIDYGVVNGQSQSSLYPVGPCGTPTIGVAAGAPPVYPIGNTYSAKENKFAIQTLDGSLECIYLAYGPGNTASVPVGTYVNSFGSSATNPNPVLAIRKNNLPLEILTPANLSVQTLSFIVRPICDPYSPGCTVPPGSSQDYPKIQPSVTILAKFLLQLPTGERATIIYQTAVSTNKYNIPN